MTIENLKAKLEALAELEDLARAGHKPGNALGGGFLLGLKALRAHYQSSIDQITAEQERSDEQTRRVRRAHNLAKGYDCDACDGEGLAREGGHCRQCCGMGKKLPPSDPRLTHDLCRGCQGRKVFRQFGRADQTCLTCGGSGIQA